MVERFPTQSTTASSSEIAKLSTSSVVSSTLSLLSPPAWMLRLRVEYAKLHAFHSVPVAKSSTGQALGCSHPSPGSRLSPCLAVSTYRIAGNFHGLKFSRISRIGHNPRKHIINREILIPGSQAFATGIALALARSGRGLGVDATAKY